MKAAVFYEPEDLRVEDVPEPDDRRRRGARRGRGLRLLRLGRRVLLRQEPASAPPTGRDRSSSATSSPAGWRRWASSPARYGLAEGDRVAVNPIQSCNACMACRAGKPQFCAEPRRARRDDERRLRRSTRRRRPRTRTSSPTRSPTSRERSSRCCPRPSTPSARPRSSPASSSSSTGPGRSACRWCSS